LLEYGERQRIATEINRAAAAGDPRQGAPGKLAKDRRCKSSTG
jgi:hypothetical protein